MTRIVGTLRQCYDVFEKFIKVLILLDGKHEYTKKKKNGEILKIKQWKTFVKKTVLSMKISMIILQPLMNLKQKKYQNI